MPRRTNPFQQLVTRIQSTLHGSKATVVESAMVRNHSSGKDTEVDILITVKLGGIAYRTAIECRDQKRSAGTQWIQELRTKRDDCRLDKIVAVHSRGFTAPALSEAKQHNIHTITIEELGETGQFDIALPFERITCNSVLVTIARDGMVAVLKPINQESYDSECDVLSLPSGQKLNPNEVKIHVKTQIRDQLSRLLSPTDPTPEPPVPFCATQVVEFNCPVPEGSRLIHPDKNETPIFAFIGRAQVRMEIVYLDLKRYIFNEDQYIIDASGKVLGADARLTLTSEENEKEAGIAFGVVGAEVKMNTQEVQLLPPVWLRVLS